MLKAHNILSSPLSCRHGPTHFTTGEEIRALHWLDPDEGSLCHRPELNLDFQLHSSGSGVLST